MVSNSVIASHYSIEKQKGVLLNNVLMRNHVMRSRAAFTLTEFTMVIVVLGILAAVTVPRFKSYYELKFSGAVKKVVADIRYAQQVALARHANVRIVFNTSAESYSVQEEYPPDGGVWINVADPFTRSALSMNFTSDPQYDGIAINSASFGGTTTLRFNWEGIPQNSSGSTLTTDGSLVLTYQGNTATIYVTPTTGFVRF